MIINIGNFQIEFKRRGSFKTPAIDREDDKIGGLNTLEFVSHELKGVLGSTIMCVYSIRDGFLGMLNFKQRAGIEATIRNLKRLESTIKDFLDISRINEGQIRVRKTEININKDIIKEVEDTFFSEIYESKMIFENRIPPDLDIKTDRNLLLTVFNNLISNAIKYGTKGGYIILKSDTLKKTARFSVFNTGEPVKDKDRWKLFKKFSRIDAEQHSRIKGTGLGLFIVNDIVKNLGGNIWFETHENGNEFIFEIERI